MPRRDDEYEDDERDAVREKRKNKTIIKGVSDWIVYVVISAVVIFFFFVASWLILKDSRRTGNVADDQAADFDYLVRNAKSDVNDIDRATNKTKNASARKQAETSLSNRFNSLTGKPVNWRLKIDSTSERGVAFVRYTLGVVDESGGRIQDEYYITVTCDSGLEFKDIKAPNGHSAGPFGVFLTGSGMPKELAASLNHGDKITVRGTVSMIRSDRDSGADLRYDIAIANAVASK